MLTIRTATLEDVRLLHSMVLEFAEFEHFLEYVTISEATMKRDGFGAHSRFHALILEWDSRPAGYAIYFVNYSSFQGPGLFLEDVFVREEFRGKGIGKAVMVELAKIALREGFDVLRWEVLDWNKPAIEFYRRLGAEFADWKPARLEGDALKQLAQAGR